MKISHLMALYNNTPYSIMFFEIFFIQIAEVGYKIVLFHLRKSMYSLIQDIPLYPVKAFP